MASVRRGGGRSFPSLLDDDTANSAVPALQLLTTFLLLRFLPTFLLPRMAVPEMTSNEQSVVDNWKEELELTTRRQDKILRSKGSDGDDDGDGGVLIVGFIMAKSS